MRYAAEHSLIRSREIPISLKFLTTQKKSVYLAPQLYFFFFSSFVCHIQAKTNSKKQINSKRKTEIYCHQSFSEPTKQVLCRAVNETFWHKWQNHLWMVDLDWLSDAHQPVLSLHLLNRRGRDIKVKKLMGWDKDKEIIYRQLLSWAKQTWLCEKLI